ncbi:MAG: hypothetical protein R3310_09700 [Candidatus Competibacteraceae bacterium]|nr:hypothetical protein [Candidatus Competibacteraceae bacterium]
MKALAGFIMAGRWQAALVAATTALLSLMLPPLLVFSGGALVLPTLRVGPRAGALTLAATLGGTILLALPVFGTAGPWLGLTLLAFWLPLWLLAVQLRRSVSLAATLQLAAGLGMVGVLLIYALLGDPAQWWLGVMEAFGPSFQAAGLDIGQPAFRDYMVAVAPLMPGALMFSLLGYMVLALLLGRWWQAQLYNPGGFGQEFRELRLGRPAAAIAAGLFALATITGLPLLVNLALALALVYSIQGVALVHGVNRRAGLHRGWLVGFYVLLVLANVQILTLLCILGVVDAWVDFRARIKPKQAP